MGPHLLFPVNVSVVVKLRMDVKQARRLARLARQRGKTKSDIIREGIDLVERQSDRERGLRELVAMIKGQLPPKSEWAARF